MRLRSKSILLLDGNANGLYYKDKAGILREGDGLTSHGSRYIVGRWPEEWVGFWDEEEPISAQASQRLPALDDLIMGAVDTTLSLTQFTIHQSLRPLRWIARR